MDGWLGRASQCGDAVSKSAFDRSVECVCPCLTSVTPVPCLTCVSVFDDRGWMDE